MRSVDLFAGCGGLSLGFQEQGFDIVAAFEWWTAAVIQSLTNADSATNSATSLVTNLVTCLVTIPGNSERGDK